MDNNNNNNNKWEKKNKNLKWENNCKIKHEINTFNPKAWQSGYALSNVILSYFFMLSLTGANRHIWEQLVNLTA